MDVYYFFFIIIIIIFKRVGLSICRGSLVPRDVCRSVTDRTTGDDLRANRSTVAVGERGEDLPEIPQPSRLL